MLYPVNCTFARDKKTRHIASSVLTAAKEKFSNKSPNSYTLHLKLEPFRAPRRQTKG